jgi:TonB family protein
MKATQAPEQHEPTVKEPFTMYLAVSVVVHSLAIVGMLGSVLWWGKPTYYKPSSYSVSLVDAPLSLQQSTSAGGGEKPADKRPEVAPPPPPPAPRPEAIVVEPEVVEAPPKPAPPQKEPEPKKPELPAPKPIIEPPKKQPEAPPAPPPKAVQAPKAMTEPPKKPSEKRPEPKEVKQPPARTPSPPASATATEAQQVIAKLREQQTRDEKTRAQAQQAQQNTAEQRLAALRERFGTGPGGVPGPGTGAGGGAGGPSDMQRIRMQLYQERIRLQIIDAWILPMPHEEARKLQATALLTVSREGEVAHLRLLQPSGNPLFDESLLRAIKHAAPLPPLPEDYQGTFLEVEMRFRPHES